MGDILSQSEIDKLLASLLNGNNNDTENVEIAEK